MPLVEIERESACRGCRACIDKCPVQVFERGMSSKGESIAKVIRSEVCIGCFTCYYQCPSQCIKISGVERQRPFYRVDENVDFVRNFVQVEPLAEGLTVEDWEQAYRDVTMTLLALAKAIENIFGFGTAAIAFQSGMLASSHFPELYEVTPLDERLQRLQQRLRHSFDFNFKLNGNNIEFNFTPCGIYSIVKEAGEPVGDTIICHLFHDYWAGLIGNLANADYHFKLKTSGHSCCLNLIR